MSTVRYKGYEILAQPYQLYGSKRWTVDLVVVPAFGVSAGAGLLNPSPSCETAPGERSDR